MPTQETKVARNVKRGDIVEISLDGGESIEEVVRDVSMILHLANGRDARVSVRDEITVIYDDEVVTDNNDAEG